MKGRYPGSYTIAWLECSLSRVFEKAQKNYRPDFSERFFSFFHVLV